MKGKRLFILTCCSALISACTPVDAPEVTASPVGFATSVNEPQTRYSQTDLPTEMGVFTYLTNGDFTTAATPNFMYNQLVSRSGDTWSYTPLKYWPTATNDKLSFFAYAPYVDEKVSGTNPAVSSGNTATGYPVLTYSLPADEVAEPLDFLIATLPNQTDESTAVKFTFKHALVKIHFSLWNADSDGTAKTVTQMSLKSSRTGTLTFTPDGGKWTGSTSNLRVHDFITTSDTPKELAAAYGSETKLGSTLVIGDYTTASVSFIYKMMVDGEEKTYTVTDRKLPATPVQDPGSTISYAICLKKDWVDIVASTGSVWTPSDVEDSPIIVVPKPN